MEKNKVLASIKELRKISKKRNFSQTFDLMFNFKQLNPKQADQKVDLFLKLPHSHGKVPKIAALIDRELATKAKIFDKVILKEEFPILAKNKKEFKKIASEYDYFLAQGNLMADIATHLGRVLGQKGKMPNPKAGCIVPPTADLEPVKQGLINQVRLMTKDQPTIKIPVGKEDMDDNNLTENILAAYNAVLHALPREKDNIKSIKLKLTMSKSVGIEY